MESTNLLPISSSAPKCTTCSASTTNHAGETLSWIRKNKFSSPTANVSMQAGDVPLEGCKFLLVLVDQLWMLELLVKSQSQL